MQDSSKDMQSVLSRLERLEAQNRFFKTSGLLLLLGIGSFVAMAQSSSKPEVIEAQRFVLVDEKGNVRACLGQLGDGSELTLGNSSKNPMMTFKVGDDSSDLHFRGRENSGMNLGLDLGVPPITLVGAKATGLTNISVPASGPVITVQDASGRKALMGVTTANSTETKSNESPSASFALLDKAKKVVWKAH